MEHLVWMYSVFWHGVSQHYNLTESNQIHTNMAKQSAAKAPFATQRSSNFYILPRLNNDPHMV